MNPETLTWRELLSRLPESVAREPLEQRLMAPESPEDRPWILNFFGGVGAWFSALFALPFFYLLKVFDNAASCGFVGVITMTAAIGLSRTSTHVFPSQLSLAALLSGNSLILGALLLAGDFGGDVFDGLTLVQILLAAITCRMYRGSAGRFLSLVAVPALAVGWLFTLGQIHGLHVIIGLLSLATGALLSWKNRPKSWDAVMWASLLSLPCMILLIELMHGNVWLDTLRTPLWPSSLLTAAVLIWVVADDFGGSAAFQRPWFRIMVVATVVLAAFTTPGLLVAMLLIFLGRSRDERGLTFIGHVFFAAFLALFYYALNINLAQKSLLVIASGVLLLLVRHGVGRLAEKEAQV